MHKFEFPFKFELRRQFAAARAPLDAVVVSLRHARLSGEMPSSSLSLPVDFQNDLGPQYVMSQDGLVYPPGVSFWITDRQTSE